jgi:hypothetical protein
MNVDFADQPQVHDKIQTIAWPTVQEFWSGFQYAAAVICLVAVILTMAFLPD